MRGRLALGAEVVGGLDDAGAEERLPVAVDDDPGGQRVGRVDQPLGQGQAVVAAASRRRQRVEERGTPGSTLSPGLSYWPRSRTCVSRGLASSMTITLASDLSNSSAAFFARRRRHRSAACNCGDPRAVELADLLLLRVVALRRRRPPGPPTPPAARRRARSPATGGSGPSCAACGPTRSGTAAAARCRRGSRPARRSGTSRRGRTCPGRARRPSRCRGRCRSRRRRPSPAASRWPRRRRR